MADAPFELVPPWRDGRSLVVAAPHAGVLLPDEDRELVADHPKARLRDADLFVDRLFRGAPGAGAALLVARVSRHVVDLNRAPHDLDGEVCPELGRAGSTPRSVLWRLTTDGAPLLSRPLSAAEVRSRLERLYRPYHDALASLLEERRRRWGRAILIDAHSMPSRSRVDGARPPEIVLSDVFGTTCAPALINLVEDRLVARGLEVARNRPYPGGYSVRRHGRPEEGRHALQIEIRRDLYLDEERFVLDEARARELASALDLVVEALGELPLG